MVRSTCLKLAVATALLTGVAASDASAAPGDLDPSFGTFGKVLYETFPETPVRDVAVQTDGRIVVAGGAPDVVSSAGAIYRFVPDGSPDPSFGDDGIAAVNADSAFRFDSVVTMPDGDIVAAATLGSGDPQIILARFDSSGQLDPGFGIGGIVTSGQGVGNGPYATADIDLALDPLGRLVAAATAPGGGFLVARFLGDGSPDPSFADDGIAITTTPNGTVGGVAVAPSGVITLAGGVSGAGVAGGTALVRYLPDGTLDPSFGDDGVAVSTVQPVTLDGIAVRTDGSIIGVGSRRGKAPRPLLAFFTASGAPDALVSQHGVVLLPPDVYGGFRAVILRTNGQILAAGSAGDGMLLAQFLPDGRADRSFSRDGYALTPMGASYASAQALALDSDGRIVVAGERVTSGFRTSYSGLALARFLTTAGPHDADADGVLDRRDPCPNISASGHHGCPFLQRSVSFRLKGGKLKGRVRIKHEYQCRSAGRVQIRELVPGPDLTVARIAPKTDGTFALDARRLEGRFLAYVAPKVVPDSGLCDSAISSRVTVP
jgi:uncharacterized delta-60 repeat protein